MNAQTVVRDAATIIGGALLALVVVRGLEAPTVLWASPPPRRPPECAAPPLLRLTCADQHPPFMPSPTRACLLESIDQLEQQNAELRAWIEQCTGTPARRRIDE